MIFPRYSVNSNAQRKTFVELVFNNLEDSVVLSLGMNRLPYKDHELLLMAADAEHWHCSDIYFYG